MKILENIGKILELVGFIFVSMILFFASYSYMLDYLPKNNEYSIFIFILALLFVSSIPLAVPLYKYSDSCLNNIKGLTTIILLISTYIGIFSAIAGGKINILVNTNIGAKFTIFCVTVSIPIRILCEVIPILRKYQNSKKNM